MLATFTQKWQKKIVDRIRKNPSHEIIMRGCIAIIILFLLLGWFNIGPLELLLPTTLFISILVSLAAQYYIHFDPNVHLDGLTAWSIHRAKEIFKGGKINEREGEVIVGTWKARSDSDDYINVSKADMKRMEAEIGDLAYVCDKRKYLGGLKSVHSRFGEPHDEQGLVLISEEHRLSAWFQENKPVTVEKEL